MLTDRPLASLASLFLFVLTSSLFAGPLAGQHRPRDPRLPPEDPVVACETGCVTNRVTVTPDNAQRDAVANTSGLHASFLVDYESSTTVSRTFVMTCTATGGVTCGVVTPASVTIPPNGLRSIDVAFNVSASGGTLRLRAAASTLADNGSYNVVVQGPPAVALRNHNGDNIDRSLCLTVGAGESAAWSCGDLVISHGMPGYATMGKERSLALVHNSATASPRPLVAATVTQSGATPDSVLVRLFVGAGGGAMRASAMYGGWATGTTGSRQVVLDFPAQPADTTGAYPIEYRVQNRYPSAVYETVVSDTLLIVNRTGSEFGFGFALAGVEQLILHQPVGTGLEHILWVGGDGSARLYRKQAGNDTTWVAPLGGFRDTIILSGGFYLRSLRHGVQVKFNQSGRHIETIAPTRQKTIFTWNPANDRLLSVTVPPKAVAGNTYTLSYDSLSKLDYIQDPAGRKLDLSFLPGGRLGTLKDPDGNTVGLGWDANGRIISRRTRRGFTTTYEYSLGRAVGSRVSKVTIPVGRASGDNTVAVTVFESWNDKGLAVGPSGQTAVPVAQAYTKIVGPRFPQVPDSATFTIDRWGAPLKTTTALGASTTLVRGNAAFPALVTKVISPDGRVDSMLYNARGNLEELHTITSGVTGSTAQPTAKTRWTYHAPTAPDSPDSVFDPENVVTRFTYDSLGLTSQVIAPNNHITQYITIADQNDTLKGLVRAVRELSVPFWDSTRIEVTASVLQTRFGFNSLGNVVSDTSPMGRVRRFVRDGKQRVANFYDAAGHRTEFKHDSLNRVVQSIQHVEQPGNPGYPADPGFTSPLVTSYSYDVDVLSYVTDPRTVTRRFSYDFANRPITEMDDQINVETRWFNRAGQPDSVRSRTGLVVRHEYDALGRKTKTAWPANAGTGADSVLYSYDTMGRLTQARTAWQGPASVTRTYYGTGALKTDVLNSAIPGLLVSQAYYYDRSGKRIGYRVGTPGDPVHSDSVSYTYDPATGWLRQLNVTWRTVRGGAIPQDWVRFSWDALGRRDSVAYSSGTVAAFAYDQDGTQRLFCSTSGVSFPSGTDMSRFQIVHDTVDQDGMIRSTNNFAGAPQGCAQGRRTEWKANQTYDNRHQLKTQIAGPTFSYSYDGSGNITSSTENDATYNYYIEPFHNQMLRRYSVLSGTYQLYNYHPDGSRLSMNPCLNIACSSFNPDYQRYLYDGLGRTVGFNENVCNGGTCQLVSQSDCFYDPLGRFLSPCEDIAPNLGYDGENVVRTDSDGDPATQGSWTFIHGPGLDDPVLGHYSGASNLVAYFVTDGNGRQYVVTRKNGTDVTTASEYTVEGGKYAGGTENASSFEASRHGSSSSPGYSFFRNRIYDQTTGRWTQEDPVGLSGGSNLYQFSGNNPVMLSDPFGLCPKDKGGDGETEGLDDCPEGSDGWKEHQKAEQEKRAAQVNQCIDRNTAWMRSDNAILAGILGVGGSIGAIGGGLAANAQGGQLVAQGTVELDLFFATPKASSGLIEGGIAARNAGVAMIKTGKGLLRGGGMALAAQAAFGVSYLGTTMAVCNINPDY